MDVCMQSCDDFLNLLCVCPTILILLSSYTPVAFSVSKSIPTNSMSKQVVHHSKYNTKYESTHGHDRNDFTQSFFPSSSRSGGFCGICCLKRFYVVYERLLFSVKKKIKNRE